MGSQPTLILNQPTLMPNQPTLMPNLTPVSMDVLDAHAAEELLRANMACVAVQPGSDLDHALLLVDLDRERMQWLHRQTLLDPAARQLNRAAVYRAAATECQTSSTNSDCPRCLARMQQKEQTEQQSQMPRPVEVQ